MKEKSEQPDNPDKREKAGTAADPGSGTPTRLADQPTDRRLTVPNVLCAVRLLGAPFLLLLAYAGQPALFLALFVFLAMTDWVDGKLAVLLNQRSVFGARLDSWADATLYSCLLLGGFWLKRATLTEQAWWIAAALGSYALTTGAGLWKFGRWPSYHTRAAKASWLVITVGAFCLLGDWSVWPFRLAMFAVTLTNLEAALITYVLPGWRANVPSLYHAVQLARRSSRSRSGNTSGNR